MSTNIEEKDPSFAEVKKNVLENMNNDEVYQTFGKMHEVCFSIINNVFSDIEHMIEDTFKESMVDKESLSSLLKFIEKIVLLSPMSDNFKTFINDINQTIFNWNRNLHDDEDTRHHVTIIDRTLKGIFTMGETINILKSLNKHLQDNELNKPTLSNGLSHAYIQLLREGDDE
jgi:hypothetical protein